MRRSDKAITDPVKLDRILTESSYVTVAMCMENVPYLVSLSHAYDSKHRRLYFHCATEGKKMNYWHANPRIWGQAILDKGYVEGRCNHLYVTAMFEGEVHIVDDSAEKRRIMNYMFDSQERRNPNGETDPHKERITRDAVLAKAAVGWIEVKAITGKKSAEIDF